FDDLTDEALRDHAEAVAGVMISSGASQGMAPTDKGVAPDAQLHAAAIQGGTAGVQRRAALGLQKLATVDDITAINVSWGASLEEGRKPDGDNLLTAFVDWSARVDNTLYVIAGNQGAGGIPVPTDEYNGVTVARTEPDAAGVFRLLDL